MEISVVSRKCDLCPASAHMGGVGGYLFDLTSFLINQSLASFCSFECSLHFFFAFLFILSALLPACPLCPRFFFHPRARSRHLLECMFTSVAESPRRGSNPGQPGQGEERGTAVRVNRGVRGQRVGRQAPAGSRRSRPARGVHRMSKSIAEQWTGAQGRLEPRTQTSKGRTT